MTDRRPNVLVIMSDQHSKRQLGCYGDGLVRTPNLDRLAAEGMLFRNAYTPSPLCVPGRSSFMTARRPTANRVWTNNHVLSSSIPTWVHSLGAAGYETALIGRMHFLGPDQRHGFERRPLAEFIAWYLGGEASHRVGPRVFKDLPIGTTGERVAMEQAGVGVTSFHAFDETVTDHTLDYLDEKAGRDAGRPFAAVAGFLLPHAPFFAPREMFDYYFDRVGVPQPTREELERQPASIRNLKLRQGIDEPLTAHQIRVARAAYYGMCEFLDQLVGRILEKLDDTGLSDNTIVIYTTDHGETAGEHGCWWKGNYYEESAGVPLIARLPGVVPAGAENRVISSYMDIGPTLIDMAGAEPLPSADGHSLWSELRGHRDESRPGETYSELFDRFTEVPSRMIRRGRWKLFKYHDDTPPALFDLEEDPEELNDLGTDPRHESVRSELLERLYEGWDPELVLRTSAEMERDLALVERQALVVEPRPTDPVPMPQPEEVEFR